jgi:hypothetical protein
LSDFNGLRRHFRVVPCFNMGHASAPEKRLPTFPKNHTNPLAVCQEIVVFSDSRVCSSNGRWPLQRAEPERVTAGSAIMRPAIRGILR